MSQHAIFPMKYLNVTQRYGIGTHVGSYAIDNAGKDRGIDDVYAPFDCVVKKIWPNGNTVWFQSLAPVLCADGSTSTVTMSFTHDNSVAAMAVGKTFKQGEIIYQEGTAGNATGNHVHIEVSKKPFSGTGWHQNSQGRWVINDGVKPEAVFALRNVTTINSGGLVWKAETPRGGGAMPITREQEQVLALMATGSVPGKDYNYRFTGLENTQANIDKLLQFWQAQANGAGGLAAQLKSAKAAHTAPVVSRQDALKYINDNLK